MKQIVLHNRMVAIVSDKDFNLVNEFTWYAKSDRGNNYYAVSTKRNKDGSRSSIQMHRLILGITDPKLQGEHRNGNGLDCTRKNLRIATHAQNQHNRVKNRNSKQKYKGIYPIRLKHGTKWGAKLRFNNKIISSPICWTEEEAGRAYDKLAIKYFGKFANLNFK